MELCYWKGPSHNFGDDLNEWLWDRLLPGWRDWDPARHLVGVGTILNKETLPLDRPMLIVGSGTGYGTALTKDDLVHADIRCVRGRGTARKLGLAEELGVLDPAVMLSTLPEFGSVCKTDDALFVPHWQTEVHGLLDWNGICEGVGLHYVSPCGPAQGVIERIAGARLVVAESMHAAIIADAFRVPWLAVSAHPSFNAFKWADWADTVGAEVEIHALFSAGAESVKPTLDDRVPEEPSESDAPEGGLKNLLRKNPVLVGAVRYFRRLEQQRNATATLRRVLKMEPALSRPDKLAASISRFSAVLDGIREDYA